VAASSGFAADAAQFEYAAPSIIGGNAAFYVSKEAALWVQQVRRSLVSQ
jgi:hypothetical protein